MPVETDSLPLVRAHQAEIWRYLRYLGASDVEAEDLAQETFLAVLRKPFEDRGPISTARYLRTVAKNLFLKSIRRRSRRPELQGLEAADELWAKACGRDGGDRYIEALRDCVEGTRGKGRRAIDLSYGDGRSRSQIATELGMSADGVKSLLRRVREALRHCVEGKLR